MLGRNLFKGLNLLSQFIHLSKLILFIINGDLTKTREIEKGTMQGCPLYPLLFILVLEVLTRDTRQDEKILGLNNV